MKSPQLRVSKAFAQAPVHKLLERTSAVLADLYGNPKYTNLPVTEEVLQAARDTLSQAETDTEQGGTAATALRDQAQEVLIGLLRKLALHVEEEGQNDLAILLSSGFEIIEPQTTRHPLDAPVIRNVKPVGGGSVVMDMGRDKNTRSIQIDVALLDENETPGEFKLAGISTKARGAQFGGLIQGRRYAFRARGIGGSTGHSPWSMVVNQWVI